MKPNAMFFRQGRVLSVAVLLPFCAALEIIRCGNQSPSQGLIDTVLEFAGNQKCIAAKPFFKPPQRFIDTYIHFISPSEERKQDYSDSVLIKQMEVLNEGYRPTGMQYVLRGINRAVNPTWANGEDQPNMKRMLRKGNYRTLNLYYLDRITAPGLSPSAVILGQCTFPTTVLTHGDDFYDDGCRMVKPTLPGGSFPGTGKATFEGKTTVHEVGHWNGLLHTFQGGCGETNGGDLVCDTPAETEVANRPQPIDVGCPAGRDTCPNTVGPSAAGEDSIHNYMNYYDDFCYNQFTPGQIQHLQNMWIKFRGFSIV